jgi:ketosteroid isomerase-like protein
MGYRQLGMLMLAIAIAFGASTAAEEPLASTHGIILTLSRQLFEALTDGRSKVWASTLADDAVMTDESGRRETKADIVKNIRPLPRGISRSIEIRDPKVRQEGETAVLDCENYDQETAHGQKRVVRYRSTLTFVKQGRDWRLTSLHTTPMPTTPPSADWDLITGTR